MFFDVSDIQEIVGEVLGSSPTVTTENDDCGGQNLIVEMGYGYPFERNQLHDLDVRLANDCGLQFIEYSRRRRIYKITVQ